MEIHTSKVVIKQMTNTVNRSKQLKIKIKINIKIYR